MARRRLHDGRADGLEPLENLDLRSTRSFAELVRAMGRTAFGGRQLGRGLDVFLDMVGDPDCTVVLTLSGAMTVAKQGSIICEMIERGLVDVIVSTGALMAHGLTESIGLTHYAVDAGADDRELFSKGYNRIYDTLEAEANLNHVAELVWETLEEFMPPGGLWSSARFCRALGRKLDEKDLGRGILRSAWLECVPVFVPAFTDSEIGLDFATWAMQRERRAGTRGGAGHAFEAVPAFNPFLDLQEYAEIVRGTTRLGIFTIGGGVPRNWAQQVSPYFDITSDRLGVDLPERRFRYAVRICPEPVHWGGLSGCTYAEGVSWGKFTPPDDGGKYAEIRADATLVWPLLMKAAFEELDRAGTARRPPRHGVAPAP